MEIVYRKLSDMKKLDGNPRKITPYQLKTLKESIEKNKDYFEARPLILSNRTGEMVVIAGNQRYEACKQLGIGECPTVLLEGLSEEREKEIIIRDNVSNGEWDEELIQEWNAEDLADWGVDVSAFDFMKDENVTEGSARGSLNEKFGIIPFSVLDTRKGDWQKRKRAWIEQGLKSEIGRNENITFASSSQPPTVYEAKNKLRDTIGREPSWDEVKEYCEKNGIKMQRNTSVFDPVLCEMMYRWFNVPNGVVVDPFAGGSVRGIVASKLGMPYNGCDIRQEQIDANIENAKEMLTDDPFPNWVCGDSTYIDEYLKGVQADMIMTCPPYADMEVYSDDPMDLSTMEYKDFIKAYKVIIKKCADMLKENRFAVFVVGEVRDKNGYYYNFVGDTIQAGLEAGLKYYNELILVNQISSLAIRITKQINNSRKIGKHHQNVIIFYKSGGVKIKDEYPPIDIRKEDIDRIVEQETEII